MAGTRRVALGAYSARTTVLAGRRPGLFDRNFLDHARKWQAGVLVIP